MSEGKYVPDFNDPRFKDVDPDERGIEAFFHRATEIEEDPVKRKISEMVDRVRVGLKTTRVAYRDHLNHGGRGAVREETRRLLDFMDKHESDLRARVEEMTLDEARLKGHEDTWVAMLHEASYTHEEINGEKRLRRISDVR